MIATADPVSARAPQANTAGLLVNALPAWLASAADLCGEIAGVQVFGGRLARVVRQLEAERVDYYFPRERVVKHYNGGRREYDRAFIPGCFFLATGADGNGWDVAHRYAAYMGWRLKFLRTTGKAAQAQLRKEVADLGGLLDYDPTLRAWQGLRGNDRCRVVQGPFQGFEGFIDREGGRSTFWIRTTIFGRSTELQVPVEYLERI